MENTFTVFNPQPRFADTQELSLLDLLSTEAQADHDAAQLEALVQWLKESN